MKDFDKKGKYSRPDGSRLWEYLAIFTCSIFAFSIGTTIGWVSPTIVKLLEPESPVPFTPEDISTMVAAAAVGHFAAMPFSNVLVDRLGRRRTLLLSGLPVIVSSAMIMLATHAWVVHIARVLVGYSLGMCLCISPIYVGEVSSTYTRGLASSTIGVMVTLGILFAYVLAPYLSIVTFAATLMTIGLLFELTFWWMPESPYYLAMIGQPSEAESVLVMLRGKVDVSDELDMIEEEMSKAARHDATRKRKIGSLRDLLTGRKNLRALAITLVFLVPQHFGGYFVIVAYCELIFKAAGNAIPSHLAVIAVGVSQLISASLAGLLVDRIGRKPLILGAGLIAGLTNAFIGSYLYVKEYTRHDIERYSVLFLVAVLVQCFFVSCGLLSVHMVIMSEIFTTEVKGIAMSVVGTCSAGFSVITSKLYIAIAITWGFGHSLPFLGFAVVIWASTIVLLVITPETKGKTFLQIQQELAKR